MNNCPTISVIIVTFNPGAQLSLAIRSIVDQNYSDAELIIIDGGSTDGTLEIIADYQKYISYWTSEKDKGIYDAMNKGIDHANGQWLYFLGADDQLNPEILRTVATYLEQNLVAVYGDVIYDTGHIMHSWLGYGTIMQNTLHHQATFYNKKLFNNFRYDTNYRVISDYELNLRIYLKKQPTLFVPHIIATCGSKGMSSVISSVEVNDLRGKYIKNKVANYLINSLLETYYFYLKSKRTLSKYLKSI